MHDFEHSGILKELEKRSEVRGREGHRIEEPNRIATSHLYESHLRKEGSLANELGIECDHIRAAQLLEHQFNISRLLDE